MPETMIMPAFGLAMTILTTIWFVILYKTNVKCPEAANLSNILSCLMIAVFLGFVSMFVIGAVIATIAVAIGVGR